MSYELLKKRALAFLRIAREVMQHGDYDLVLFHVEQFIQLYSKYLMYRKIGDYPKTHQLVRLLKDLSRVYDSDDLRRLISDNLESLYLLEEAYISSRYLPREYDQEIAGRILKVAEKILGVFKCLESAS